MTAENKRMVTAAHVRQRFGNISDMSLWRWINDKRVGFPAPVYISRRRFWREVDLDIFEAAKASACAPPRATPAADPAT